MKEFHFKKFRRQCQHIIDEYTAIWQKGLPEFHGDFYAAAESYFREMSSYIHDREMQWSKVERGLRFNLMIHPVFESILRRCPVKYSFTALTLMPEYQWLNNFFLRNEKEERIAATIEQMTTMYMMWFMQFSLKECGDKAYMVKPDLRWALENTELKGFPADELHLPFPAVYIDVEGLVEVFNPSTGMHKSLGVYITEDVARTPRAWRILVVGKGKAESEGGEEYDDALYHFQILLPEGMTVDKAVQYTFDYLMKGEGYEREVEVDFDGQAIKVKTGFIDWATKEHFTSMWQNLVLLFKYIMNVAVYTTTQDADVQFRATSPEYVAMRERGLKAAGDKRRRIFDALKKVDPNNAFVVGGSIIIDRQPKVASDLVEEGERRHQRVRSLVSGHYHTYRVGTGRADSIRKWLSPYWRGPEHAPLTTKTRVVK